MLKVHHLNDSRSQKTVWLLEELALDYEVVPHLRHAETLMGPAALRAAHPIGKAPILEDEGQSMVESGAIAEYILTRYGNGRLMPDPASREWMRYLEWMYFAVSIGMTPILLRAYARFAGGGDALDRAAEREFDIVLGYIEQSLGEGGWILGEQFTAADIQLSFVPELARSMIPIDGYHRTIAWLARCRARPAYAASLERGAGYAFGEAAA